MHALKSGLLTGALVGPLFTLVLLPVSPVSASDPTGLTPEGEGSARAFVPNRSNAYTSTYQESDGSFTAEAHSTQVNFRASDGGWNRIDNTLIAAPGNQFTAQNAANKYVVRIPSDPADTPLTFSVGGATIESRLRGAESQAPDLDGATATLDYRGNIDVVTYEATNVGVKEDIVVGSMPETRLSFVYDISVSQGLTPKLGAAGAVQFLDSEGQSVAHIPAGFMFDSAPSPIYSEAVQYELRQAGSDWVLKVSPDHNWLTSPARQYPVVVDPSINVGGTRDCFIGSATPDQSACGSNAQRIKVGRVDAEQRLRGLLAFPGLDLPEDAMIRSAIAQLYLVSGESRNNLSNDYVLRRAGMNFGGGATWNTSGSNGLWDAGSPVGFNDVATRMNGSTTGWKSLSVTDIVAGWTNGSFPNAGLVLMPRNAVNNVLNFHSGAAANPPKLIVDYALPVDEEIEPAPVLDVSVSDAYFAAVLNCMKEGGEVSETATSAEVLGSVDNNGIAMPPLSVAEPIASEACLAGAQGYMIGQMQTLAEAPIAEQNNEALERVIQQITAEASAGDVTIVPEFASDDAIEEETPDPVVNDGFVFARAAADCEYPKAGVYLNLMNFYDDIDLFPNFKTASGNEPFCYLRWDDNGCTGVPDSGAFFNFKYPCKRHDFGWRNLHRVESHYDFNAFRKRNKNVADKRFLRDMRADCKPRNFFSESFCRSTAQVYYQTVSLISPSTFTYTSPSRYVR